MVIIIKKILKVTGGIGKAVVFIGVLTVISTAIISYALTKQDSINPYCNNKYENEKIELNYSEILKYEYRFDCSTLYFDLIVDNNLSKQEILSLVATIGQQLKQYDCFTHFEVFSDSLSKPIYVSINLKTQEISYVGG